MEQISLTSSAFQDGEAIPPRYTADGENVSPLLQWTDPPSKTSCFALICDDPDAPRKVWVHWLAFNIPAAARQLAEGLPAEPEQSDGLRQGTNDFHKIGYGGPAPPAGKPHRYFFHLYALDTTLQLQPGASRQQLEDAMHGHILAEGKLLGTYQR